MPGADAATDIADATNAVTVSNVNSVPSLTDLPSDVTAIEDVESNLDLSGAIFADTDAGDTLTVTLSVNSGIFSFLADGASVGVTETLVDATTITLVGTAANINIYLDTTSHIKYTGASNINGDDAATISVSANDNNGSGNVSLGTVSIDITAVNDAAVLSNANEALTETDGALSTGGTLTNNDVDNANTFQPQSNVLGTNGTFNIDANGAWTYVANSAFDSLNVGDSVSDTFTVTATDGTETSVEVTINGSNDVSVVSGTYTGSVTEGNVGDAAVTASGSLGISDADGDDSPVFSDVISTAGDNGYGAFVLSSGTWTYTLNQSAVQDLDADEQVSDTITYTATDGTAQQISVTLTGSNDASVISGTHTDSVTEGNIGDAVVTASGSLGISDVDGDDSPVFNDVVSTTGDNGYGAFVLNSGTWTYTLDQSTVQDQDDGDTLTDRITYTATDGTEQQITVNLSGSNDTPQALDKTLTINEDGSHIFSAGDFGFSDTDDGDVLVSVKIVSLPDNGVLTLNSEAVEVGAVIAASDISGLVFSPGCS